MVVVLVSESCPDRGVSVLSRLTVLFTIMESCTPYSASWNGKVK